MTTDEKDDPEASFRRGYQQGAFAAFEYSRKAGFVPSKAFKHWMNIQLYDWRYGSDKHDRAIPPPDAPNSN